MNCTLCPCLDLLGVVERSATILTLSGDKGACLAKGEYLMGETARTGVLRGDLIGEGYW